MSMITLESAPEVLLPGIARILGTDYPELPILLDKIFYKQSSDMNAEYVQHVIGLGMAAIKPSGSATVADGGQMGTFLRYTLKPPTIGLMYSVTREILEDNLYPADFRLANLGLAKSTNAFLNVLGHAIFNNAATADPSIGGDGVAFAGTHQVRMSGGSGFAGSYSTTTTIPQSLSEASLIQAVQTIPATYVDNRGLYMQIKANTLMCHNNKHAIAMRLLGAQGQPDVISNNPNVLPFMNGGIKDLIVSPYFTNQNAWYLTTDQKGFCNVKRKPFEITMYPDFKTDNLEIKSYCREGFFLVDCRGAWLQLATA